MKLQVILFFVFLVLAVLTTPKAAHAVTVPTFPTCSAPQGDIKVQYDQGTHGIPGETAQYQGSDRVFWLTEDLVYQCFCAENDQGVQTNWWKVSSLSAEEINDLRANGWIYVPNGALWGLAEAPYLAKNQRFNCGGQGGVVLGAATIAKDVSGQVLGLATTGGQYTPALVGLSGLALVTIGWRLRKLHL